MRTSTKRRPILGKIRLPSIDSLRPHSEEDQPFMSKPMTQVEGGVPRQTPKDWRGPMRDEPMEAYAYDGWLLETERIPIEPLVQLRSGMYVKCSLSIRLIYSSRAFVRRHEGSLSIYVSGT